MNVSDLISSGQIDEAFVRAKKAVKSDPTRADARWQLFELFCVCGEWQRAFTQLQLVRQLDPSLAARRIEFQPLIECELVRQQVFLGASTPVVVGEPAEWVQKLLSALRVDAQGLTEAAAELREEAHGGMPPLAGSLDGQAFTSLSDADPRLGSMFEAVVGYGYRWVPMDHVSSLVIQEHTALVHTIWTPVTFVWAAGGQEQGYIPTRYPGTGACADTALRLGRATDWEERPSGWVPVGHRLLCTDGESHHALGKVSHITFSHDAGDLV